MVSCPGHEVTGGRQMLGIPSGPGIVVIEMMRDVCKIISVHRALAGLMGIISENEDRLHIYTFKISRMNTKFYAHISEI